MPTGYPGLLMATPRTSDPAIVGRALDELEAACRRGDERGARAVVARLVPEYAGGDTEPAAILREVAPP